MGEDQLRGKHELVNLLPRFPGKCGKGDAFPIARARRAARRTRLRGDVLLVGKAVARAFGFDQPFFRWAKRGCARIVVVPHSSGVSHWWNDPANVARASEFLRAVLA